MWMRIKSFFDCCLNKKHIYNAGYINEDGMICGNEMGTVVEVVC